MSQKIARFYTIFMQWFGLITKDSKVATCFATDFDDYDFFC